VKRVPEASQTLARRIKGDEEILIVLSKLGAPIKLGGQYGGPKTKMVYLTG
jgi:hypothetical protein